MRQAEGVVQGWAMEQGRLVLEEEEEEEGEEEEEELQQGGCSVLTLLAVT